MTSPKPLRLWPGVVAAALIVLLRLIAPIFVPAASLVGFFAAVAGTLAIIVWWLFFSRAAWSERVGAIVAIAAAILATRLVLHRSIATGMMGMMFFVYAVPAVLGPAFVAWAVLTRRASKGVRRVSMVATIFLACAVWTLFRTDGIISGGAQLAWRWTKTPEERLLARGADEPAPPSAAAPSAPNAPVTAPPVTAPAPPAGKAVDGGKAAPVPADVAPNVDRPAPTARRTPEPDPEGDLSSADWPGFRGPERDGVIRGIRIETDWSASPPVEIWRRPIGPGWSSFAVRGDFLYTQEQRGDDEIVGCYRVADGKPVWRHRDPVRFWESNGGAGPRGTPTSSRGRVYAFGATGILNALDARTGRLAWSRNVASDAGRKVPDWGFASSPLVIDDLVIVAASGTLAAYDAAGGHLRWLGPRQLGSYSSPHRVTIDGVTQVLLLTGSGAISIAPATGAELWKHEWQAGGAVIVQPALTEDGDVLVNGLGMTGGTGIRRLGVAHGAGNWSLAERWTSAGLKPYFNDFVVHKGHAYGFDGAILASISLDTGTRTWKGGRYGNGQMVLLADQDLLLVMSEEGELALVSATPDQFREMARFKALDGKTWNHPVIAGDVLLVRNGEEMAAFRLPLARR
jgi:outer membrane protein assembly factor BamB